MPSPAHQRQSPATPAVLTFLIAAPLMFLVAVIVVQSLRLRNEETITRLAAQPPEKFEPNPPTTVITDEPRAAAPAKAQNEQALSAYEPRAAEPKPSEPPPVIEPVNVQQPASMPVTKKALRSSNTDKLIAPSGILALDLDKETYDALMELNAAVESQAWEDAGTLITTLNPETAQGLAPYIHDRSLLTSLPVAVELTREDYPQLRQVLNEKFTSLGDLRLAAAIREANASSVEFATVQFADMPAAAEAHRWLANRALVSGRFSAAVKHYERACKSQPSLEDELMPRIRLASAMMGRDAGAAATKPVAFGEVSMTPAEFERLVHEMRARGTRSLLTAQAPVVERVPPPSELESHTRSRLDGPTGERPQDDLGRRINQFRVPWVDRQIAATIEGDRLYVTNRFQVAAYNLAMGERLWQSEKPPGAMQRAQEWGLIAMRPVMTADRIFVRLLYSASPLLVCLEKSSGKLLWASESREHEFLVSDPLIIQGQLVALSVVIQPDQQGQLRFIIFDPQTGEAVRSHDLLALKSTWGTRACCEVVETEDGLAIVLGGAVAAVDAEGKVRWARAQSSTSADEDPRWATQLFQRPILHGGRLFVAQPGVRAVECLDAHTGRRHWSVALPDVVGLIGLSGDLLTIQTEGGVQGRQTSDGALRWQFPAAELFSFHLVDDQRLLIATREPVQGKSGRWQPRLTWLNPADGSLVASTALPELADADPRLGPLVHHGNRLFLFWGHSQNDPIRDIVELTPRGPINR